MWWDPARPALPTTIACRECSWRPPPSSPACPAGYWAASAIPSLFLQPGVPHSTARVAHPIPSSPASCAAPSAARSPHHAACPARHVPSHRSTASQATRPTPCMPNRAPHALHPTRRLASRRGPTWHRDTAGFAAHRESGGGGLPARCGLGGCPAGLLYIGQPCPGQALNGAGSALSTRRVIRGYFWGQQLQAFVTFGP